MYKAYFKHNEDVETALKEHLMKKERAEILDDISYILDVVDASVLRGDINRLSAIYNAVEEITAKI